MRQKLIILLLTVGLIPALAMGVVAYSTLSRNLTKSSVQQVDSTATRQAQRFDGFLQNDQEAVTQLAFSYEFQVALDHYFNSKGSQGQPDVVDLLKKTASTNADLLSMYITTPQGIVWGSTNTQYLGQKLAANTYTVSLGEMTNTQILTDPTDGIIKLLIATPLSFQKKESAELIAFFRLDKLVAAAQDYTGLGSTGETLVTNTNDSKSTSLFPLRFDTNAALTRTLSSLQLQQHPNTITRNITDYRNKAVILSSKQLNSANWTLAVKIDRDEALAPIDALRSAIIIIFLTTSIVIILLALYFARTLTAPIIALTTKTRYMINGDFQHPIAISSSDEVGTLAVAFNTMASKLEESYKALEDKVKERTQDLQIKIGELRKANAQDEAILSSIGDGMVVTDNAGWVLLTNTVARELLDIDSHTGGKKLSDLYTPYDENGNEITSEMQPTQLALSTRQKVSKEVTIHLNDGTKRALNITATPVLQQDEVLGTIQTFRDVTKEKEVDRMKTEFISLASHQLRTPLSAIKWFSEMLLNGDAGKLSGEQTDFTQNIVSSTDRMIALVNSLLNISRIESGRIMIDPKPTDLEALINSIIADVKTGLDQRHQTIVVSVNKELPEVNLDARLISQVYLNLLTNAIKYTPEGGEISVFVSRDGDQIVSQVTDNGYGIPVAQQGRIFEKFFRAANAVKVETDGTGLGLYLIKAVVESSGGKIWFKSEEGKGTTFWFSIPLSGMKAKQGEVSLT